MPGQTVGSDVWLTPSVLRAWLSIHRDLRRGLAAGNAGGVIAAMSVLGTLVARSGDPADAESVMWILLIFVLGLAGATLALGAELRIRAAASGFCNDQDPASADVDAAAMRGRIIGQLDPLFSRLQRLSVVQKTGTLIAGHCQAIGVVAGLAQLFLFHY